MALVPVRKRERGGLARLHDEMDDLIGGFFGDWDTPFFERGRWPAIDIAEEEDKFLVKVDVPGCKADDVDISVHGNMLTISGEKKKECVEKEKGYYHAERCCGSFRRELNLPTDIDTENIEAACKDGILSITLPKTEKTKAVKVKIKEQ